MKHNQQTNINPINISPLHTITPLFLLGKGAFGSVYLVNHNKLTQLYKKLNLSCNFNELHIQTCLSSDSMFEVFYGEKHANDGAKQTEYDGKKEELKSENLFRHE